MAIEISLCAEGEVDEVQDFLDQYWAPGHVLARSRVLFDWQYRQPDGSYGMLVARSVTDARILGTLGFIPSTRFDPGTVGRESVWLALWKVRDDAGAAGLGLALLSHLSRLAPWRAIGALGLAEGSQALLAALGYRTGTLSQYYFLNRTKRTFRIARVEPHPASFAVGTGGTDLVPLAPEELDQVAAGLAPRLDTVPARTAAYFRRRFLNHPAYRYDFYGLCRNGTLSGLLTLREASAEGERALRLVDYLGPNDGLAGAGPALQALLESCDAEYMDVFNHGLPRESFLDAGFARLDSSGPIVVPNHFEPFSRTNSVLRFAVKMREDAPVVLFKADGDQDRPNRMA